MKNKMQVLFRIVSTTDSLAPLILKTWVSLKCKSCVLNVYKYKSILGYRLVGSRKRESGREGRKKRRGGGWKVGGQKEEREGRKEM